MPKGSYQLYSNQDFNKGTPNYVHSVPASPKVIVGMINQPVPILSNIEYVTQVLQLHNIQGIKGLVELENGDVRSTSSELAGNNIRLAYTQGCMDHFTLDSIGRYVGQEDALPGEPVTWTPDYAENEGNIEEHGEELDPELLQEAQHLMDDFITRTDTFDMQYEDTFNQVNF